MAKNEDLRFKIGFNPENPKEMLEYELLSSMSKKERREFLHLAISLIGERIGYVYPPNGMIGVISACMFSGGYQQIPVQMPKSRVKRERKPAEKKTEPAKEPAKEAAVKYEDICPVGEHIAPRTEVTDTGTGGVDTRIVEAARRMQGIFQPTDNN